MGKMYEMGGLADVMKKHNGLKFVLPCKNVSASGS